MIITELLHSYTRLLDLIGAPVNQKIYLSKEAIIELKKEIQVHGYISDSSGIKSMGILIEVDGYGIEIIEREHETV